MGVGRPVMAGMGAERTAVTGVTGPSVAGVGRPVISRTETSRPVWSQAAEVVRQLPPLAAQPLCHGTRNSSREMSSPVYCVPSSTPSLPSLTSLNAQSLTFDHPMFSPSALNSPPPQPSMPTGHYDSHTRLTPEHQEQQLQQYRFIRHHSSFTTLQHQREELQRRAAQKQQQRRVVAPLTEVRQQHQGIKSYCVALQRQSVASEQHSQPGHCEAQFQRRNPVNGRVPCAAPQVRLNSLPPAARILMQSLATAVASDRQHDGRVAARAHSTQGTQAPQLQTQAATSQSSLRSTALSHMNQFPSRQATVRTTLRPHERHGISPSSSKSSHTNRSPVMRGFPSTHGLPAITDIETKRLPPLTTHAPSFITGAPQCLSQEYRPTSCVPQERRPPTSSPRDSSPPFGAPTSLSGQLPPSPPFPQHRHHAPSPFIQDHSSSPHSPPSPSPSPSPRASSPRCGDSMSASPSRVPRRSTTSTLSAGRGNGKGVDRRRRPFDMHASSTPMRRSRSPARVHESMSRSRSPMSVIFEPSISNIELDPTKGVGGLFSARSRFLPPQEAPEIRAPVELCVIDDDVSRERHDTPTMGS